IGNRGRRLAMSDTTRTHLDSFWLVVDESLNAVLFLLIGLEVLLIDLTPRFLAAGVLAVPVVLVARFLSVGAPIGLLRLRAAMMPYALRLMTWSALRGGIAIALALSLPASAQRGLILVMTYVVVVFSLLVQGPTVEPLARRAKQAMEAG
ncbi:MAG: sodium:proton antiporter, partial [Gemmatimonadota bacterium]